MLVLTGEKARLFTQLLLMEPGCAKMRFSEARIVPYNGRRYLALQLNEPEVAKKAWLFFHPDATDVEDVKALSRLMECDAWTGVARTEDGELIIEQGDAE